MPLDNTRKYPYPIGMTGDDLRFLRKQSNLTQTQIAEEAGWAHKTTVSKLEKLAVVPPGSADKYLAALRGLVELDRKSA